MLHRVNKIARFTVESLPAYSLLEKHASDTPSHARHAVSHCFPISQIFAEFCHPWCGTCDEFGPYIFFPSLTRSCYKCNFLEAESQARWDYYLCRCERQTRGYQKKPLFLQRTHRYRSRTKTPPRRCAQQHCSPIGIAKHGNWNPASTAEPAPTTWKSHRTVSASSVRFGTITRRRVGVHIIEFNWKQICRRISRLVQRRRRTMISGIAGSQGPGAGIRESGEILW